jgi:hypothetical protein
MTGKGLPMVLVVPRKTNLSKTKLDEMNINACEEDTHDEKANQGNNPR